ncbi:MAG: EAL domain-containing protein [Sedimenticola sp.]
MNISTKIVMSYLIICLVIGAFIYSSINTFQFAANTYIHIIEETTPLVRSIENLRTAGLRILASSNEYAMIAAERELMTKGVGEDPFLSEISDAADEEEEELIEQGESLFDKSFEAIRFHIEHAEHSHSIMKSDLDKLANIGTRFRQKALDLVEAKKEGLSGIDILEIKEELEELEEEFLEIVDYLLERELGFLSNKKKTLSSGVEEAYQNFIISSALTISFIFLIALVVRSIISVPVNRLMSFANKIGRGDLDARVEIKSGDELGKLSGAVNVMVSDLKRSILKEKEALEKATVATVSAELERKRVKELHGIIERLDSQITKRKKFQHQLSLASNIIENAIDGIILTDDKGKIIQVNPSFSKITGYTEKEVIGKTPNILKSDRHDQKFYQEMWDSLLKNGMWKGEIWNRRKNGETYPEWLSITAFKGDEEDVLYYVAVFHDISELKRSQEEVQYQAYHDPLTKLPNRTLLNDRLRKLLEHTRRHHKRLAFLYLDVDDFKNINDAYGHYIGDLLLVEIANILAMNCRAEDTVARWGGDEFVVLMSSDGPPVNVVDCADRVLRLLAEPFSIEGIEIYTGISIGISIFPDDGDDAISLAKNADLAMYQAKKSGKNMFHFFTNEMDIELQRRVQMEAALRKGIENNEFVLYYQPKIEIDNGEIVGCEALIRWQRADGELVPPVDFIPLAEETKLIVPIGEWVLYAACKQAKCWHDNGFPLTVAVNLSAQQFRFTDLVELIQSALQESGLSPSGLEIEVTESILMENQIVASDVLGKIRGLGVKIAIDDFGTGYSSLAYLKNLPLDILKIDRSFIKDIPHDSEGAAISRAILSMSKDLNLKVVAEGVETHEHLAFLKANECEMMQGYLFSAPLPINDIDALLHERAQPSKV